MHSFLFQTAAPVSTHSRPKAAVQLADWIRTKRISFNTQPPEGGCAGAFLDGVLTGGFNTQPPEGGCEDSRISAMINRVSTHSRPKAAVAFSETFIHQGLHGPDSLKLSENAKSEYNTALFRHTRFPNVLIVKEQSCIANHPAFS
ncbi:Uncharacterised protein [Neisseria weaveri]|uniref:Uncharacterized protein n=1 Tax=Neisseria weaveri TaxID=28091 RepID=A0A448VHU3_9NEIS|nr:Uncharacterised protein [Neisseria weaveri]